MAIQTQAALTAEVLARVRSGGAGGLTTASDVRTVLQDIVDTLFNGDGQNTIAISTLSGEVVMLSGGQLITGLLTYGVLPESSNAPTLSSQLTNKAYVDGAITAALASVVAGGPFDSSAALKLQVPGIEGLVLNKTTISDTLQALLYPVKHPLVTLSIPIPYHDYGDTGPVVVSWTVTKTDQNIDLITVAGATQTPTGATQSGTTNVATGANGDTTIAVVGGSQGSLQSQSVLSALTKKVRIGGSMHDGIILTLTDSDLQGINSYFVPGGVLAGLSEDVTIPANEFLVIEVPVSLGTPLIYLDGLRWTLFNLVRNNGAFVNNFGYTDEVNVWVSTVPLPGNFNVQFR